MASQVAHIVYAKKYFQKLETLNSKKLVDEENILNLENKLNKDEFILGCIFPDIRTIDKNINRSDTHSKFFSIDLDFEGLSSFEAGWKFHLYCDMKREEILNKYNFYDLENAKDFFNRPAKFLEDELIYDDYNNWEKISSLFRNPPYMKTELNITQETVNLWYAIIAKYFEQKPNNKSIRIFLSKLRNLTEKVDGIMEFITKLKTNRKAVEILGKVKEEIV